MGVKASKSLIRSLFEGEFGLKGLLWSNLGDESSIKTSKTQFFYEKQSHFWIEVILPNKLIDLLGIKILAL